MATQELWLLVSLKGPDKVRPPTVRERVVFKKRQTDCPKAA